MSKHTGLRFGEAALRVAAFAALAAAAAPIGAQNIVQNPNFATSLPPWTPAYSSAPDPAAGGSILWISSQDANGAMNSGAASVSLDANAGSGNASSGIHQCVSFAPTLVTQANYGAKFKLPGTDAGDGKVSAIVEIRLFSDNACSQFIAGAGGFQGRAIVAGVPDDANWYSAADASFTPPSNTTAQSAMIRAALRSNASTTQSTLAFFDDIYLSLNGTTPVSLQSFDVD